MVKLFLLCIFVILSIEFSHAVDSTSKRYVFEPQFRAACTDAIAKCNDMYGPIPDILNIICEGRYMEDESFQKIVHCSYKSSGFTYGDGHVKIEEAAKMFPQDSNVLQVMRDCDKENGKDEVETTFKFFKCFQKNSPVNIGV